MINKWSNRVKHKMLHLPEIVQYCASQQPDIYSEEWQLCHQSWQKDFQKAHRDCASQKISQWTVHCGTKRLCDKVFYSHGGGKCCTPYCLHPPENILYLSVWRQHQQVHYEGTPDSQLSNITGVTHYIWLPALATWPWGECYGPLF